MSKLNDTILSLAARSSSGWYKLSFYALLIIILVSVGPVGADVITPPVGHTFATDPVGGVPTHYPKEKICDGTTGGSNCVPATAPADNSSNPSAAFETKSHMMCWDATNSQWDRCRGTSEGRLWPAPPHGTNSSIWSNCQSSTNQSDVTLQAAQGSGNRNYVTWVIVDNESGNNSSVLVKSAATTKARIPAPANFGGAVVTLPTPIRGGDNEAILFASTLGVSTMFVCAGGYVSNS